MRDSSVEMLQSYLTRVVESIVGSVEQCPPVMRVAFKQLHKRVEEQFAEPENEVSVHIKKMPGVKYDRISQPVRLVYITLQF